MKNALPFLFAPLILLILFAITIFIRFMPARWRVSLLGISALLVTLLPGNIGCTDSTTCYVPIPLETPDDYPTLSAPVEPAFTITSTAEWQEYRRSYLAIIDYIAGTKYDETTYNLHLKTLQDSEIRLNTLINDKTFPKVVADLMRDGLAQQLASYDRGQTAVTCYVPVMTPEFERSLTFSNVVGRQIELRKLILTNTPISPGTLEQITKGMFLSVEKYLAGEDLALYKRLMLDLVDIPK